MTYNSLVPLFLARPPFPPLALILAFDPAESVHAEKLTAPPEPPPPPPNELQCGVNQRQVSLGKGVHKETNKSNTYTPSSGPLPPLLPLA